jgi:hypothetical protein
MFEAVATLWLRTKQEITSVQLLWEAAEQVYFRQPLQKGLEQMGADAPLLYGLMQTAMMESLLMRVSRLMDQAVSGKGSSANANLSLARLAKEVPNLNGAICELRQLWDASGLRTIRDKYLSHNDLARASTEVHTLNMPLSDADVATMRKLATALREFRRTASQQLDKAAYLDESLSLLVDRDIDVLNRSLLAGECFYKLLPEHAFLQDALHRIEKNDFDKEPSC